LRARAEAYRSPRILSAFPLLRDEAGVHVFEIPQNGKSFRRCTVRVRIAPQPDTPARGSDDLRRSAKEAFATAGPGELAIVRRYREEPSPLVRDSVCQWRSGRLDTVLAGDFDLMH
jgi:ATP-dependent Clp protease ATP-binding subunit ClpC